MAHRHQMEPVVVVQALAKEHQGRYRRGLLELVDRMRGGSSFIAAAEQIRGILSDESSLALRFGSQSGTTDSVLSHLLSIDSGPWRQLRTEAWGNFLYRVTLAVIIVLMVAFMNRTSGVKLEAMYDDFGMRLPIAYIALQTCWTIFLRFGLPSLFVFLLAVFLWPNRWQNAVRRNLLPRLSKSVAESRVAHTLQLLAIAERQGRPLVGSLSTLAKYHYDRNIRLRLLDARNEIEQGIDNWSSLAGVGILSQQQAIALLESPDCETRAWVLEQFASAKLDRSWRVTSSMIQWTDILATLAFAAVVLWICVAFFSFLTLLSNSLS